MLYAACFILFPILCCSHRWVVRTFPLDREV